MAYLDSIDLYTFNNVHTHYLSYVESLLLKLKIDCTLDDDGLKFDAIDPATDTLRGFTVSIEEDDVLTDCTIQLCVKTNFNDDPEGTPVEIDVPVFTCSFEYQKVFATTIVYMFTSTNQKENSND